MVMEAATGKSGAQYWIVKLAAVSSTGKVTAH
jgi:hypothetical protein